MTTYDQFAKTQGVAIPIIQRDYVQGLDSNFAKRDKFLKRILEALESDHDFEIDRSGEEICLCARSGVEGQAGDSDIEECSE